MTNVRPARIPIVPMRTPQAAGRAPAIRRFVHLPIRSKSTDRSAHPIIHAQIKLKTINL
ncbi:hypothetical protein [Burkholderia ubonensis]|uniref:hypothetical protein n=1 Tax=Burkholderia ubonensis TaxID=101571 RepID=UPI000AC00D7E|nr:hypothetical protein [Burkholderia ubonensis]